MSDFITWLNMGGHGIYIWPAYLITFIVLLANLLVARWQRSLQYRKASRASRSTTRRQKTTEGA